MVIIQWWCVLWFSRKPILVSVCFCATRRVLNDRFDRIRGAIFCDCVNWMVSVCVCVVQVYVVLYVLQCVFLITNRKNHVNDSSLRQQRLLLYYSLICVSVCGWYWILHLSVTTNINNSNKNNNTITKGIQKKPNRCLEI